MFAALAEGASHPAVAAWLGLGTAGVAAVVVAMAWSVNARQIRLAEQLARRQFLVTSEASSAGRVASAAGRDRGPPGALLLLAAQPGELPIIAGVREGLPDRRATKWVTAVPEVTPPAPPFTLRLFLHGWGLVVVAVLIVGFAGALDALGNFTSSDFIALAVPLAALLGVIAVARGCGETGGRPRN